MDLAILKEFGFPIALSAVLLLAVRHMFSVYAKAQADRINAIERALGVANERAQEQAEELLRRSDLHARALREIITHNDQTIAEHSRLTRATQDILKRLVDTWASRPCVHDHEPHDVRQPTPPPRTPSGGDIPQPVTERTSGRA